MHVVNELKDFLMYLSSLWGVLSAFSAFFPLVNRFKEILPLPENELEADAYVLLSTVTCLFIILVLFTSYHDTNNRDVNVAHKASREFVWAIVLAAFYIWGCQHCLV